MPHSLTERIAAIKRALSQKRVPETRPPSTPFVINPATRDAVKAQLFNLPHLQHYEVDTDNPLPEDPVALQRSDPVAQLSASSSDPVSTVFISPSIRENSTTALPNHPRMQALRQLLTRMGHSHEVGEGVWSDGREEVAVAKVPTLQAKRVAAKLGKLFAQKAVLTFTPGAGTDQLHTVRGVKEDELNKRGIEHKTMLPSGKALIVDTDGSQATKLAGLPFDSVTGRAEFLDADNRAAARAAYDRVLNGG